MDVSALAGAWLDALMRMSKPTHPTVLKPHERTMSDVIERALRSGESSSTNDPRRENRNTVIDILV